MISTSAAKLQREAIGKAHSECPICQSSHLEYEFVVDRSPVCACQNCGLLFLNPQPGSSLHERPSTVQENGFANIYAANAEQLLARLTEYSGLQEGKLLLVGANTYLSVEAHRRNFEVTAYTAEEFELLRPQQLGGPFEACLLFCALERMKDPLAVLKFVRTILRDECCLMVVCPTTDSRTARFFGSSWWEFSRTNLFYFSVDTLQSLLIKAGFGDPVIAPDRSRVSLNYLRKQLVGRRNVGWWYRVLRVITTLSPVLRNKAFRMLRGRTNFLVRRKPESSKFLLSVIVPVYNEGNTFKELIEQLLLKTIDGVDIEVIIVESNSTDGTRDYVLGYENHPRVRLILEEEPKGKGHAVRMGLKIAKGDVILFQDADLEYDLNDYQALVYPVLRFENNFILGSRHGAQKNSWKIRSFSDSPGLSVFFNFGHLLFLVLFNALYAQRLKDPFTMFKVFRRECLYGLTFECNRFDFDFEIVIKLLRKGYQPLELPVNYKSRSISEGKKVTVLRDPLTWLRALVKFRRSPLYGEGNGSGDLS